MTRMIIRPGGGAGQQLAYAAGRFAEKDDAYIVTCPGGTSPFGGVLTSFGSDYAIEVLPDGTGASWFAGQNLTTPNGSGKACYLKDEESDETWSAFVVPVCEKADEYEVSYRPGQVTAYSLKHKIATELTMCAVPDYPCELWLLRVENRSAQDRHLTLTTFIEPCAPPSIEAKFLSQDKALLMRRPLDSLSLLRQDSASQDLVMFHSSTLPPARFQCRKSQFLGEGRTLRNPRHVENSDSAGFDGLVEDLAASFTVELELPIEGEAVFGFCFGIAASADRALETVRAFSKPEAVVDAIARAGEHWKCLCSTLRVQTPDSAFDALVNTWLPYESYAGWVRERSDSDYLDPSRVAALLRRCYPFSAAAPELCRENLLNFAAGLSLLGAFSADGGALVSLPTRELLWLATATAAYIAETGDCGVLSSAIPLMDGPPLTLKEHCERAIRMALNAPSETQDPAVLERTAELWTLITGDADEFGKRMSALTGRRSADRTEQIERRSLPRRASYLQSLSPSLSEHAVSEALTLRAGADDSSSGDDATCAMYAALVEDILGVRATCDGLVVDPHLPANWCDCEMVRRFRGDTYRIKAVRAHSSGKKGVSIVVDGEPVLGNTLPYFGDGGEHQVDIVVP